MFSGLRPSLVIVAEGMPGWAEKSPRKPPEMHLKVLYAGSSVALTALVS